MTYDKNAVAKAAILYARIDDCVNSIKHIESLPRDILLAALDIQGKPAKHDGRGYDDRKRIFYQDAVREVDRQAIARLAIDLQLKSLRERINAAGRELAQLGFVKPECCK